MSKFFQYGILCCLLAGSTLTFGQEASQLTGAQILRAARTIYDQGRLHELPAYLDARKFDRLNTTEKVEAYKILVLTYIYLEEPERADENMLRILETDHFFEPIESDQNEFKNLYKKFRTKPVVSFGIRGGLNQTLVRTLENDFIAAESESEGTYTPNLGFNVMLTVEKQFGERLVVNPEIGFITSSFTYNNDNVFLDDPEYATEPSVATHKFTQSRGQLNLLVHYKLYNAATRKDKGLAKSKLDPYVFAGPAFSYLLSSTFEGLLEQPVQDQEGTVDNTASFTPFTISAMVGAGIRYKMGSIYLTADLRYSHGLMNITDEENRYAQTPENIVLNNQFAYVQDNISLNQAMIQVGIVYPYFIPKKLIK